jgi:hypothetical protein
VFQRCPTRDKILFPVGQSNCKTKGQNFQKISKFQKFTKISKFKLKNQNFHKISKLKNFIRLGDQEGTLGYPITNQLKKKKNP